MVYLLSQRESRRNLRHSTQKGSPTKPPSSDVNKDLGHKDQDFNTKDLDKDLCVKDKDQDFSPKDQDKDFSDKDKDLHQFGIKDHSKDNDCPN